ncbi:RNA-binding S4 domain-containing protein [Artemisia annua]|uniref:RNA-binding S4 domain-containing protein n=1 Tax=Artemisia annua TaxID=35608 RepID=A0A2U1KQ70_ARTAN|nr:RNA-binding S4 domain-containing protein [Artemisia annua]
MKDHCKGFYDSSFNVLCCLKEWFLQHCQSFYNPRIPHPRHSGGRFFYRYWNAFDAKLGSSWQWTKDELQKWFTDDDALELALTCDRLVLLLVGSSNVDSTPVSLSRDEKISCIVGELFFQPCSHGDFLGSIFGTGIARDKGEKEAHVNVVIEVADFVTMSLDKVGNVPVTCKERPLIPLEYETPSLMKHHLIFFSG